MVSRKFVVSSSVHSNTYSFFALYANVDNFNNSQPQVPMEKRPEIDRWIISLLNSLIKEVDESYNDYEPTKAGRAISNFVNDHLSNWYVRLNRKRFWGGTLTEDKLAAYQTLYTCLDTVARLMAPIAPFYADQLFLDLNNATGCDKSESVHLADFPKYNEALINKTLEERMQLAQDISSMTLSLRKKENIKVRQPLKQIMVPILAEHEQENIEAVKDLIMNEVNVKEINFVDDSAGILVKKIKPDFKKLGPKCGKNMKTVAAQLQALPQEEISKLEKSGSYEINIDGNAIIIDKADVEILSEDIPGWLVANNGTITIALDVTITPELQKEGIARELINRIQNLRKDNGFEVTDKVNVTIYAEGEEFAAIDGALAQHGSYIAAQTLSLSVIASEGTSAEGSEVEWNEGTIRIKVSKN